MIAMMRPALNAPVTESQKAVAREEILFAVQEYGDAGVHVDTIGELRTLLDLGHISMNLFKNSLWHLKTGDRDDGKRSIAINEPNKLERHRSHTGKRISIRAL